MHTHMHSCTHRTPTHHLTHTHYLPTHTTHPHSTYPHTPLTYTPTQHLYTHTHLCMQSHAVVTYMSCTLSSPSNTLGVNSSNLFSDNTLHTRHNTVQHTYIRWHNHHTGWYLQYVTHTRTHARTHARRHTLTVYAELLV